MEEVVAAWNTRAESTELAAAKAEIARLDKWRLALESLTAQGSEFYNDLDRCVAYVRERYAEGHKAKGDRVKLQRSSAQLKARAELAERKLAIAVEALEHYGNRENWQEPNAGEIVTYCVWQDFPRELRNGPDIAQAALKDISAAKEVSDG